MLARKDNSRTLLTLEGLEELLRPLRAVGVVHLADDLNHLRPELGNIGRVTDLPVEPDAGVQRHHQPSHELLVVAVA